MNSKKTTILILILIGFMIPDARALIPQSQTVKITDTHDDKWITELGIGVDSSLVNVKDPGMDLRAYLVFREIDINYWEPLKNATLRLHTASSLSPDPDSSITIYGMKFSDLQDEGYLSASEVLSMGFTSANTVYNTSEFYGSKWNEIDVTSIVDELIRNTNWDGDGISGSETGDAIGFHILGAKGDDKRYFYDFSVGNGLEAQLILHWNHEPPPPFGGAQFIKTHGDNYTIWYSPGIFFNFSTFTHYGAQTKESGRNDTYFYVTNMYEDSDSYLRRDYDDYYDDSNPTINVKFGMKIINLPQQSASGYVNIWGVSDNHAMAFDYNKGYTFTLRTNPTSCNWMAWAMDASAMKDSLYFGPTINEDELPVTKWFNITMNMETRAVVSKVYEDQEMTILNHTYSDTFTAGTAWGDGSWLTYEYVNGPTQTGYNTGYSGAHLSEIVEGFYAVTDPNGTIIETDIDSLEDAEEFIENYDPDTEDPNPGGEWEDTGPFTRFRVRLYILILGISMILGPPMFFAYRRPSGYVFVVGIFIMLMGFAFMIHVGSI